MQPTLYKKILRIIDKNQIKTITVDIFDTILLNDYWPEDLRYFDLAKRWVADLYQITALQITPYELLDLRKQAETELQDANRPLQIDLILDIVLDLLCAKYDISLSSDDRLQILATLIATEIQFKIANTRPNHNLIAQLKSIKEARPEMKIYFLTDTPFFAEQIKTMLQILDIKIFDGGISSSDLGCEKRDGKIFELLDDNLAPGFNLMSNLHIGDHRVPDYLMPILHDSQAIHYRPVRMRGMRTTVGKCAMQVHKSLAYRREKARVQALFVSTHTNDWEQYGAIVAQYRAIWNTKIQLRAGLADDTRYLLARSISDFVLTSSATRKNATLEQENVLASTLDKTTILRAFVWLLATFETTRWNAAKLLELLTRTAKLTDRQKLYQLAFSEDYMVSNLAMQSLSDAEFYSEFLTEIKTAEPGSVALLRESYEQMVQLLPRNSQKVCIVEQNNDDTAMLFREFARLHGINNEIMECILDADGSVTAAETRVQDRINTRRLACIKRGYQNGPALLRQTELNHENYIKTILKPQLKRVVKALN